MKIWKGYGSAHSAHLTVVGKFANIADATLACEVAEDFVNADLEERYADISEFAAAWKNKISGVQYLGPDQSDYEMGLDRSCDVEQTGETVVVSGITSHKIGGIIKLLLLKDPSEVKITGQTGP